MKRHVKTTLLLLTILPSAYGAAQDSPPRPRQMRIVGGHQAPPSTAPWQIEIFSTVPYTQAEKASDAMLPDTSPDKIFADQRPDWDLAHQCGGAWLGDGWVVTAAHCLYHETNGRTVFDDQFLAIRQVRMGTERLTVGGATWRIAFGLMHAAYAGADSHDSDNDIALLKLAPSPMAPPTVPFLLTAISLPRPSYAPLPNAPLLVTGWGRVQAQAAGLPGALAVRTSADAITYDPMSDTLKELALHAVPTDLCAQQLGYAVPRNHTICAVAPPDANGKPQDQCGGDSGGPLTRALSRNRHELVGLVSGGKGCAQRDAAGTPYPGVFTAVAPYVGWIAQAQAWGAAHSSTLEGHMQRFPAATP